MKKIYSLFFILVLTTATYISGQKRNVCNNKLLEGFVQDGPEYSLKLEDSKTGKIFLSFFEGFQYRLVICSENTKKYKIALYDIEKKVLFSGTCEDYIKYLDLKFKSSIACIAEIRVNDYSNSKARFSISIGFKEVVK